MRPRLFLLGMMLCMGRPVATAQVWVEGPVTEIENRKAHAELLYAHAENYYLLRCRNGYYDGAIYLEKWNGVLEPEYTVKLPAMKGQVLFTTAYCHWFYVFCLQKTLRTGKLKLMAYRLNYSGVLEAEKELASLPITYFTDDGSLLFARSPGGNRLLFYTDFVSSGGLPYARLIVTDSLVQQVTTHEPPLPTDGLDYFVDQLLVTDSGNTYLLSTEDTELKPPNSRKDKMQHRITRFAEGQVQTSVLDTNQLTSGQLMCLRHDRLAVAGYFAKFEAPWIEGSFYTSLNTNSLHRQWYRLHEYPDTFRREVIGEKQFARGVDMRDYELRSILPTTDGGYLLVGENTYTSEQANSNYVYGGLQTNYKTTYHYNHILVERTDSTGNLVWQQIVRKTQTSVNDLGVFSGYFMDANEQRIRFVYNKTNRDADSILMQTLTPDGRLTQTLLATDDKAEMRLIPARCRQLADGRSLLLLHRRNGLQLVLLFNDAEH